MKKTYDFRQAEKEMQQLWEEFSIYRFDKNDGREVFSIDTPPPTVSGSLHIGHIFSYAQAEMIARYKRMQGYNVFYPFGFDDNGLPTERLVEREDGIFAKDVTRGKFIEKCSATAAKYVDEFRELWQSLGFSVDWSLQYETISPMAQRISQRSFLRLYREGKAYMKESPVLWCTECQTSIAQAELDTRDKDTVFSYIPFRISGQSATGRSVTGRTENAAACLTCGDNVESDRDGIALDYSNEAEGELIVATTRPELLYGCVCLFVNPQDERYAGYIGSMSAVPLYGYEIPVKSDEKVDMCKGTGVVMCATFGDSTDVEWYGKHKLPFRKVILADGTIARDVPFIGGLPVTAARKRIIHLLEENGLLVKTEQIVHTVAVHERCGKDIEIIPSKQWYIDILSNKQAYLKAANEINWYPEHMKNRYILWVENLKWDWCISRQRYFGVPIPMWYCKACGKPMPADEGDLPVNPQEVSPKEACCCGCTDFIPENAVLDTWATSSVTPQINARWGEADDMSSGLLPMSMRTQAHEIIRTWAFYTIVKSLYHTGRIPWRDIMICGFVLAKKGEKISKSKNNSDISPKFLIESHSADVIRYWSANSRLGTDTFFSRDELGTAQRFVTKLWNAAGFSISHLQDFDPGMETELLPVDLWIMESCKYTIHEAAKLLDQYETGAARHVIDDFFWRDFCDNYLEIVKERLYQPDIHGEKARRSAQKALYATLLNILKLYAIYVPHITEYIYQDFYRKHEQSISLHKLIWDNESCSDNDIMDFGEKLKEVIAGARKFKSERSLSMKADMDRIVVETDKRLAAMFERTIPDIRACCRAKEVMIISREQN
ncbi:MAG TPA: valine--tRNA ligase [Clostridia bacterium]|nr:valine--tRNA ligase [Clostridia bacterium]